MTLTLLLDLDDTLLDTNMEQFIPAYFQALSKHLESHVAPDVMLSALASGTRRMMVSLDPSQTLRQIFEAEFYPRLGLQRDSLGQVIEKFYDEVFPSLGVLMKPRPEAVGLVDWAFAQGYRVVIATDPLFPLKAIHHRLRFAGLPPEKYPFALVSSYETFHFTKSHAAYFAELMGDLGWPEGPILMVGNDADRDLAPAGELGLPTYWINGDRPSEGSRSVAMAPRRRIAQHGAKAPRPKAAGRTPAPSAGVLPAGSHPEANGRGSLSDLRLWLESVDLESLEPHFTTRESYLGLLTAIPACLSYLVNDFPDSSWTRRPAPAEWALTEVLCHYRDTDREVNQPRLKQLLTEDEPFIPARDTNAWVDQRSYLKQDGRMAFGEFISARMALLEGLRNLTEAEWGRKARHSIFGPTTLLETVGFMAEHDRLHIQQIWKIIQPAKFSKSPNNL